MIHGLPHKESILCIDSQHLSPRSPCHYPPRSQSSLPWDPPPLTCSVAEHTQAVTPHLHVPLQAGQLLPEFSTPASCPYIHLTCFPWVCQQSSKLAIKSLWGPRQQVPLCPAEHSCPRDIKTKHLGVATTRHLEVHS